MTLIPLKDLIEDFSKRTGIPILNPGERMDTCYYCGKFGVCKLEPIMEDAYEEGTYTKAPFCISCTEVLKSNA